MIAMSLAILLFLALFLYIVDIVTRHLDDKERADVEEVKNIYQNLQEKEAGIHAEKKKIQKQTEEIFALYDITRQITQNFDAAETFEIFKNRLKERTNFVDCRLIEAQSEEIRQLKILPQYFLFPLQSKNQLLGFLTVEGLEESERDKVAILGHQLALALRRIKLYEEVERLALTDSLTEVHTRRYFMERFEEELKRAHNRKTPLSLLMIDVDYFKRFNDQYGHMVGDQILHKIGMIIKENIRGIDIVGRYGGEEFVVVLPDTDRKGAGFVAERIRSATEATQIQAYDTVVSVTISIGLTVFPDDAESLSQLIEKADQSLYQAKSTGRNRID
ncbi:MAG: hypothetical protein A3D10_08110 [Omnitrophica WOR_2 bacterium RIFCSPHIGHO2_02_FULL_48_11]|nr:MAG: hypothetical protein A3D10_08110 [Omnitrophica WOR_2 bacterium RIFCSPHIGHO2_02_FULL_48_11]